MARGLQPTLIATTPDILLVEDDAVDAELTLSALNQCGYSDRVAHVTDGVEALDYIATTRGAPCNLKLILLDLKLRNMSGLHVLRQLKADERTRGIPVVVLTSSRMAIELLESYKLGVNSYVIKPVDADKFDDVIEQISTYWLNVNETSPH